MVFLFTSFKVLHAWVVLLSGGVIFRAVEQSLRDYSSLLTIAYRLYIVGVGVIGYGHLGLDCRLMYGEALLYSLSVFSTGLPGCGCQSDPCQWEACGGGAGAEPDPLLPATAL